MKIPKTPAYLTYFVTNRCQLNCLHCFYYQYLNTNLPHLGLVELRRIVKSLVSPLNLLILTGGEPFLRRDLDHICYIFSGLNHTKLININSNGWQTNYIYNKVKEIRFKIRDDTKLNIQISLDGLEDIHDRMRGSGSFKKAVETIRKLKTIKILDLSVMTTICKLNYKEIKDLIPFVRNLGVKHKFQFIRDNRRDVFGLRRRLLSNFHPPCNGLSIPLKDLSQINSLIDGFEKDSYQKRKRHSIIKSMANKERIVPCVAGLSSAVLYPNGDVSFCESLKIFANIRDFGYSFEKLWSSAETQEMRNSIKKCSCTDPCSLLASIYEGVRV